MESNGTHSHKRKLAAEISSSIDHDQMLRYQELETHVKNILEELQIIKNENRTLKSQIDKLQQQYDQLASQNQKENSEWNQYSHKIHSENSEYDTLVKQFEERCDLVESSNQTLTERLDSCQQTFENQLTNLQQQLNNFGIQDTKSIQQQSVDKEMSSFDENNDGGAIIEEALCTPCESQISLSTDEIQYGLFDICE
ncbi:unnamed protein product, partial [Adineta ricciae]